MSESSLQSKLIKKMESLGYWVIKVVVGNKKGIMDIIACAPNGKFVGVEVKFGDNAPTELQSIAIQEVIARGGTAFVAWNEDDLLEGLLLGQRDDGTKEIVAKITGQPLL